MTKIIVNADDFGYSRAVNWGIIDAHKEGILSSTTLMVNMPGVEHAIELAAENKKLGVGIHLALDIGFPINSQVPSLVDKDGRFLKADKLILRAKQNDIKKELTSQIERFLSYGIVPTHIDSHHHIHGYEKVFSIVKELAKEYQLPIRKVKSDSNTSLSYVGLKTVDYFNPSFYGEHLTVETLKLIIQESKKYDTVEIMTHPAYIDNAILTGSSYHSPRVKELAILTDIRIQHYLEENGITLITYKDI